MNVTSLLNTTGAAQPRGTRTADACQREARIVPSKISTETSLSNRSRTPWDADGYCLPLTLNLKNTQNSQASRPVFFSELPPVDDDSPTRPKQPSHRNSDSHSSLSSYTTMSSNNSNCSRSHSRISSLSTVSEYRTLSMFGSDTALMERAMTDMDAGMSRRTVVEAQPASPSFEQSMKIDTFGKECLRYSNQQRPLLSRIAMRDQGLTGTSRYVSVIHRAQEIPMYRSHFCSCPRQTPCPPPRNCCE